MNHTTKLYIPVWIAEDLFLLHTDEIQYRWPPNYKEIFYQDMWSRSDITEKTRVVMPQAAQILQSPGHTSLLHNPKGVGHGPKGMVTSAEESVEGEPKGRWARKGSR